MMKILILLPLLDAASLIGPQDEFPELSLADYISSMLKYLRYGEKITKFEVVAAVY